VLSGPPGTGKTELAKRLPTLLWREAPQTFGYLPTELDRPPVETRTRQRKGYYPVVVTATEDWGVRDLVGGIGPKLEGVGASSKGPLTYAIQYGVLTRVVLQNYAETKDGQALPPDLAQPQRQDYYNANERYRGSWLIIDEFTRAPVDAAFGSLLTTLSGSGKAYLTIPLAEGEIQLPLPRDFRIIGTLNSFDRHFLNQISEALKRRFDFIDVLPPSPKEAEYEQGVAIARALAQLWENRLSDLITFDQNEKSYSWEKVIRVELKKLTNTSSLKRYQLEYLDPLAKEALTSFWRLFSAIRVFRQLGTAQLEAVYTNLFTDVLLLGQSWSEALDTALADSLADQLQVLTRDEQRILIAYLDYADNANNSFVNAFAQILSKLPAGRQTGLLHALCEADRSQNEQGDSDIVTTSDKMPTTEQHGRVFELGQALNLPPAGKSVFRRRLRDLIGERGL